MPKSSADRILRHVRDLFVRGEHGGSASFAAQRDLQDQGPLSPFFSRQWPDPGTAALSREKMPNQDAKCLQNRHVAGADTGTFRRLSPALPHEALRCATGTQNAKNGAVNEACGSARPDTHTSARTSRHRLMRDCNAKV